MSDPRESSGLPKRVTYCVECVMTWLLYGDGAKCLACNARVFWRGEATDG